MNLEILPAGFAGVLYVAAGALAVAHMRDPKPTRDRGMMAVVGACSGLLIAALVLRGARIERFPAFGGFEAATWYALATTTAYLYVGIRHEVLRTLSVVLLPCMGAVVFLGLLGVGSVPSADPRLRGVMVGLHVTMAFAGYGLFTLESLLGGAYLIQDRNLKRKRFTGWARRLPSLETLDKVMRELIGVAFALFTLSIGLGVTLAHVNKWGVAWAKDPKVMATGAT